MTWAIKGRRLILPINHNISLPIKLGLIAVFRSLAGIIAKNTSEMSLVHSFLTPF